MVARSRKYAEAKNASTEEKRYGTGGELTIPRQQFQLLYREVGFDEAYAIGVDDKFILWHRQDIPPPFHYLYRWAAEADQDGCQFNEHIERAFKKRWANYPKQLALRHVRENIGLVREYSQSARKMLADASKGEYDEKAQAFVKEMTPILQHANVGASFMFREHQGAGRVKEAQSAQTIVNGNVRVITNRNKISPKRIKEGIPPVPQLPQLTEPVVGKFRIIEPSE